MSTTTITTATTSLSTRGREVHGEGGRGESWDKSRARLAIGQLARAKAGSSMGSRRVRLARTARRRRPCTVSWQDRTRPGLFGGVSCRMHCHVISTSSLLTPHSCPLLCSALLTPHSSSSMPSLEPGAWSLSPRSSTHARTYARARHPAPPPTRSAVGFLAACLGPPSHVVL